MKSITVEYGGFSSEQEVDENLYEAIYQKGKADAVDLVSRHLWNYDHEVYRDFEGLLEKIKEQKNE